MKMEPRIVRGAMAIGLVTALVAPMTAWAIPGRAVQRAPKANASRSATATAQLQTRRQMLADRIDKMLANRARAFDQAASQIATRIVDVREIAAKVGEVGDVSAAIGALDAAQVALDAARAAESQATDMFKAVSGSADRKAAFADAKVKAKAARAGLAEARSLLRTAILRLEVVVNGLPGAAE